MKTELDEIFKDLKKQYPNKSDEEIREYIEEIQSKYKGE